MSKFSVQPDTMILVTGILDPMDIFKIFLLNFFKKFTLYTYNQKGNKVKRKFFSELLALN